MVRQGTGSSSRRSSRLQAVSVLPIDGATPAVDPNGSHRDAAHPRTSHGASHGSTTSDLADQERYLREHADTGGPQIAEFAASLQRFAPTERDRPRARSSAQTSSPQPGEHEDLKPTIVKAAESLPSSPMTVKAEQDLDANRSAVFKSHVASSPSTPKKRKRKALASDNGQFEGMQEIPDRLADNLDILFCGYNPGVRSSEMGFHYAHPSNRFYRILHDSGLTPYRLHPSESPEMPAKYKLGLTDLVARCTARADQVPTLEFQAGATTLLEKMIKWKPKMVCFVGMDVYRNFRKHFPSHLTTPQSTPQRTKGKLPNQGLNPLSSPASSPSKKGKQSRSDVQLGLQILAMSIPGDLGEDKGKRHVVRLFVIPSTSGLAAGYSDGDRVAYLEEAKEIVKTIRDGNVQECDSTVQAILNAEDYLETRIVRSESGEWVHAGEIVKAEFP